MQWNPEKWSRPRRRAAGHQAALGLCAQAITGGRLRLRRAVAHPSQAQQREGLWEAVPMFPFEAVVVVAAAAVEAAAVAAVAAAAAECCGESGHPCLTIVEDDDASCPPTMAGSMRCLALPRRSCTRLAGRPDWAGLRGPPARCVPPPLLLPAFAGTYAGRGNSVRKCWPCVMPPPDGGAILKIGYTRSYPQDREGLSSRLDASPDGGAILLNASRC
jgi:hypothetical protein